MSMTGLTTRVGSWTHRHTDTHTCGFRVIKQMGKINHKPWKAKARQKRRKRSGLTRWMCFFVLIMKFHCSEYIFNPICVSVCVWNRLYIPRSLYCNTLEEISAIQHQSCTQHVQRGERDLFLRSPPFSCSSFHFTGINVRPPSDTNIQTTENSSRWKAHSSRRSAREKIKEWQSGKSRRMETHRGAGTIQQF